MHALRLDIRQESFQTMCTQGHENKITVLTSDHRLLLDDYLLRWPSSKKCMASVIDRSYIALPSTRTDLEMSTRQFQKKVLTSLQLCLALPGSHCLNQLPKLCVRSWNNNIELREARSQVQRAHHKFDKYRAQYSIKLMCAGCLTGIYIYTDETAWLGKL